MSEQKQRKSSSLASAALLSAVGFGVHELSSQMEGREAPPISINSLDFVEFQINQLAKNGIKKFFLEVEELPGSLVAVADRAANIGVSVKFVRSPAELRGELEPGQLLFVLADNVFVDQELLTEIVSQKDTFILTVDGRDDNAVFERIDLNSFWTGIAMLSAVSVEAIAALPEEWSISSSLLRRALQDSVVHRPIKQEIIVAKQLCKVTSAEDANFLSKRLLVAKSRETEGVVEKYVFAPMAVVIAPIIWNFRSAVNAIMPLGWIGIFATLGAAIAGYSTGSAALALLTIFIFQCRNLMQGSESELGVRNFNNYLPLILLMASFLALFWHSSVYRSESLFCGTMVCGLMVLSGSIPKNAPFRGLLRSPALVAFAALLLSSLGIFVAGFMVIALLQLSLLAYLNRSSGSLH
jgi:hypothetical protein